MHNHRLWKMIIAGLLAGMINGLFGAGGGMVLVPLLTLTSDLKEEEIFPASISIILPICMVSLAVIAVTDKISVNAAVPYMLGSILGGIASGKWGKKIPVSWLHRLLGVFILWGGIRYLC